MIDEKFYRLLESNSELSQATHNIRKNLTEYIVKYKLKSLVLGVSGGIDSALCAALAATVCQQLNIPLIGRSISIETNRADEIERSILVGKSFCTDFQHVDFTDVFLVNKKNLSHLDHSHLSKLRQGNMKARMRMMSLYDLAQLHHGIVLATDNFSEYLTGFWTLHGDVGDYAPMVHLWKTEVYRLATFLLNECNVAQQNALQLSIDAIPEDGLGISNSDYEQLGVTSYVEADQIFLAYFQGNAQLENHILIQKYLSSEYKRNNPVYLSRNKVVEKCFSSKK